MATKPESPMRIRLDEERRAALLRRMRTFCDQELALELSDFQGERLLAFLLRELGAPIYNQAIQDARQFMQDKLVDLEGEFYEPEA